MSRQKAKVPTSVIKEHISDTSRYRLVCLYCGKPSASGGKDVGGKFAHAGCHQRASAPPPVITVRSLQEDQIRALLEARLIDKVLFHHATRPRQPDGPEARDRTRSNARARCVAILNEQGRTGN